MIFDQNKPTEVVDGDDTFPALAADAYMTEFTDAARGLLALGWTRQQLTAALRMIDCENES